MTTPDGEIIGCGYMQIGDWWYRRPWESTYITKPCPAGIKISLDNTLCNILYHCQWGTWSCYPGYSYSVWSDHVFVSTSSPVQTVLAPETITKTVLDAVKPDQVVKSFAWTSEGCDRKEEWWGEKKYYCHAGLRANYLLADNSIWDGHYFVTYNKTVYDWGIVGFLAGFLVNLIIPGAGTFLWGWGVGDVIFVGSLFIPGAKISISLPSGAEVTACSGGIIPLEISQPEIKVKSIDCDEVTLGIIPDATKTGKVNGYELYRQKQGETTQTLVKKQEGLSLEQSQAENVYTDTGLEVRKNYLYFAWPIVSEGERAFKSINVKTICPPKCDFSASPQQVIKPGKSTLSWSCKRPGTIDTCAIKNDINYSIPPAQFGSGTKEIQPQKTTTYYLTCKNSDGEKTWSTIVKVFTSNLQEIPAE